jgi:hypothetical protein
LHAAEDLRNLIIAFPVNRYRIAYAQHREQPFHVPILQSDASM